MPDNPALKQQTRDLARREGIPYAEARTRVLRTRPIQPRLFERRGHFVLNHSHRLSAGVPLPELLRGYRGTAESGFPQVTEEDVAMLRRRMVGRMNFNHWPEGKPQTISLHYHLPAGESCVDITEDDVPQHIWHVALSLDDAGTGGNNIFVPGLNRERLRLLRSKLGHQRVAAPRSTRGR